MDNLEDLKTKLREKIKAKKAKEIELAEKKEADKKEVIDNIASGLREYKKRTEETIAKFAEKIDAWQKSHNEVTNELRENDKKTKEELVNLSQTMTNATNKIVELNDTTKNFNEVSTKLQLENLTGILTELKNVTQGIKEQGKYEKPESINLADVEEVLQQIRDKELPAYPELSLKPVEGLLDKLVNKEEVNLDEIEDKIEKIQDVLLRSWLPQDNALKVMVGNFPAPPGHQMLPVNKNIHTGSKELMVASEGHICTANSTNTPLGANKTFTGDWQDTLNYSEVIIMIYTDRTSITDGLDVQWSTDGVTIHSHDNFTISATSGKTFTFQCVARYVRVVYTNDGDPQTYFTLQTQLKRFASKGSSHRLKDALSQEDDAIATTTLIKGFSTAGGGQIVDVKVSPSGAVQVGGELAVTGTVTTADTYVDDGRKDAFGRERVSVTGQRFDSEFILNKQPMLFDEVITGGATIAFNQDSRDLSLRTGGTAIANSAMMIQHWHNPYTPGNGQLIDITGTLNEQGISGGVVSIVLKNNGSEREFIGASWSQNTMASMDYSKSQIFAIDFQSLKVGRVRTYFVRDGLPVEAHRFLNDNRFTGGYWQYANLPAFWKTYNGASYSYSEMGYGDYSNGVFLRYRTPLDNSFSMRAICTTVKSEGGKDLYEMPGYPRSADTAQTTKTVATTLIPLISIRPSTLFGGVTNIGVYLPQTYSVQTDNPVRLAVLYRPILTGASFAPVDSVNSGMDFDTAATAVSGGIKIASEYISTGRNTATVSSGLLGKAVLAVGYGSSGPDILTLAAIRTTTTSANALAEIGWSEIR